MKKKMLIIPLAAFLSMGTAFAIAASRGVTLSSVKGLGDPYYHYEAVAATCASYGIKEYWTNCKGDTTIVEPIGVDIVEKGQPSAAEIQFIVDTYGASDERIIAKSDVHGSGVESADCLGKEVCSICGATLGGIVPTIDFSTNGIYGMYDWYLSFGAPDAGWVSVPSATSIQFLTYNPGFLSEIQLPRIYFAGFDCVSIDLSITYKDEVYSFDQVRTTSFTVPSNSYAAKLVFSNISDSSMTATLRDSSDNILLTSMVVDVDVLNGTTGFKFYAEGVYTGVGYELLSNFTFVKDCVHSFVSDPNCIGKEICSTCGKERSTTTPTIDFTQSLYGAYDVWEGDGSSDPAWTVPSGADKIQFVNAFSDGSIFDYHLPRIYFAAFSSVTIDLVVNYAGETFALTDDFASSWATPFSLYDHAQLVFENISGSSMTVKFNDAFGTTHAQVTCSNAAVLNGLESFVLYVKGSGNIAYDTFQNFTFVA